MQAVDNQVCGGLGLGLGFRVTLNPDASVLSQKSCCCDEIGELELECRYCC